MKIGIANDHRGYKKKQYLTQFLEKLGYTVINYGTDSEESVDFPDYAKKLGIAVREKEVDLGIAICGTGIGMSIAANRNHKIRAALCKNFSTARLARQHNDANVLVLAGRSTCGCSAKKMLHTFLTTEHLGGVYSERMAQIDQKN